MGRAQVNWWGDSTKEKYSDFEKSDKIFFIESVMAKFPSNVHVVALY